MKYNIPNITVKLFVLRALTALITFFMLPLSIKYFGISIERDIWVLVSAFTGTVIALFFAPLNEIFRAKFVFLLENDGGKEAALNKLKSLLFAVFLLAAILSIVLLLFPLQIKKFVAPAIKQDMETVVFVKILWMYIPTIFFQEFVNIGISILNAFGVFYIPEIFGVITSVINLFCVIFLAPKIGIYVLIVSAYTGLILLFIAVIFFLCKNNILLWRGGFHFYIKDVWIFVSFALPFYLSGSAGQFSGLLERSLANLLGPGVVSTIDYSRRFTQILQTVLSSVLASVMVPALTGTFSKNNKIMFGNYFRQSLKMTLIINTAAVPFLFGAAAPICEYFYFRGQITQKIIENIIVLTRLYALTIPGISFVILFSLSLISQQQGKRCALMGMGIQLIMIVLNSFLFRILGEYIFSLTSFISHTVVGFLMLRLLDIEKKKDIVIEIVRYIIPAIVFSAVLINLNKLLPDYPALIRMCINAGVLAVFSFLVFQFFMKINIVAKVRILLFR